VSHVTTNKKSTAIIIIPECNELSSNRAAKRGIAIQCAFFNEFSFLKKLRKKRNFPHLPNDINAWKKGV
jgi:hypothetical protein